MAKDKRGFMLYADMKETFDQLPDDKAASLIRHIFAYVNDENPTSNDLIINIAFAPIKQQLKRDLDKYRDKCLKNKENANKRWDANVSDGTKRNANDADNDKGIDKDIDIFREKDHLHITWGEMNKLIDEFGEEKADTYINQVLNYRKNTKYKSLYLTALNWLKRDFPKDKGNQPKKLSI